MSAKKQIFVLAGMISFGVALRFLAMLGGHNYDFDSYLIVLEVVRKGGNVYAETIRYNYAPLWFNILWMLDQLAGSNEVSFRILLVLFLSSIDAFIFLILQKKFGFRSATFFLFNPISIFITGFHNQFDNLAILIALCSTLLLGDNFSQPLNKRRFAGLIVLGISLVAKHLFFIYPLWLAIKQKGWIQKFWILFIPALLFLLSFIPYIGHGATGILQNVFLYQSYDNEVFYRFLFPDFLKQIVTSKALWLATLVYFAFYFKKADGIATLLYYLGVLVITAPAITNQYLAIPLIFFAANLNAFSIAYTLIGAVHLVTDIDGLRLFVPPEYANGVRTISYLSMILILTLSLIRVAYLYYSEQKEMGPSKTPCNRHLSP